MTRFCFNSVGDAHLLCKRVSPSGLTASPPFPVPQRCYLPIPQGTASRPVFIAGCL